MATYLKKFETQAAYEAVQNQLLLPNVSLIISNNTIYYNPVLYGGHEYVEIGGIKWATKNVGAQSITDTGLYFQWGDPQGYTTSQAAQKTFSNNYYKFAKEEATVMTKYNDDGLSELEATDDMATVNMGNDWKTPTQADYITLINATDATWTNDYQNSGVAGLILTDKNDSSKVLFFPAGGYYDSGGLNYAGDNVFCWSSTVSDDSGFVAAFCLQALSGSVYYENAAYRYNGLPLRGVVNQ